MNVGLVVPGFSADAADWCIPALRHLARALATTNDVRVIAVRYPYRRSRYELEGFEVIAVGGATRRGGDAVDVWRTTLGLLRSEHTHRPFDVLHAFWATESGLLAAVAGRLLRVPTLVSLAGGELAALRDIGYGDQRLAWERLKVWTSLRLATWVSAGSRWLIEIAMRHLPRQRIHRAPLGVPLDRFHPPSAATEIATATGQPRLLHVGTLTPVKDQAALLRAFDVFREQQPRASLTIVGDGPLRARLTTRVQELCLDDVVSFRGEIDHGSLADVYRACDMFVLSSRHEAQGMVALEAAACGLAVVGTRVGVIPELTSPVATVAPVGDPQALATALAEVCTAPAAAASFARNRVETDFGLQTCTDRFLQLYAGPAHA
jgi:glycosyltransferase involved in cell wall biosynthesis